MLEQPDTPIAPPVALLERMRSMPGLAALVAEAQATWVSRAKAASSAGASGGASGEDPSVDGVPSHGGAGADRDGVASAVPAWRAFSDAFPTFYEFTNRPR